MADRPNILVFMTDDHGRWATGCYGNREVQSPSLDHLAHDGALMASAFTPCPVCSPARASFHTGLLPSAHGVHDYIDELGVGRDHPGIAGRPTLASALHDSGYRTGLVGKWHLNNFRSAPAGFDTWFTLARGTNARFGEQRFYEGDREMVRHGQQATFLTDRAVRFLNEASASAPFFLFVGYTDTHTPHSSAPRRLVRAVEDCRFDDAPLEDLDSAHGFARIAFPRDAVERRRQLADYYASVAMIDQQVGRVLDELDNLSLADDTLVIYTADHGHMNGHHGLHSKGNATVPQNFLEESILVPCMMRWPGHITAGQRLDGLVDHCDLHATIRDAAGLAADESAPGRSYLPALLGRAMDWRDVQFCEYGNARMARTARYKLIVRYAGPNGRFPDELYDLQADPRERCNCIDDPACGAVVADLRAQIDAHFARHETSACTGRDIARQPICNGVQPWVVTEVTLRQPKAARA